MARTRARARGVRELVLLLSILLADPGACTPFIAARTQPAARRKVGLVAAHALHGAENTLRSPPSIPALILATLFETVLHRAVCSSPCDAGSVLMMTPASAALDEEVEDGDGATRAADVSMGRLVVQMAQSYFRGLATLVRMLLRQPEAPQALILLTILGYASQLAIGPSLARSGARLTSRVRRGEVHRLFSSLFLHADALHLYKCVFSLSRLAPPVAAVYGGSQCVLLFLLSGACGNPNPEPNPNPNPHPKTKPNPNSKPNPHPNPKPKQACAATWRRCASAPPPRAQLWERAAPSSASTVRPNLHPNPSPKPHPSPNPNPNPNPGPSASPNPKPIPHQAHCSRMRCATGTRRVHWGRHSAAAPSR